jgi:hypothetical protein
MAQVKIQVRFNKRTMGALYHSLYFDVDDELMIDGDYANQEYSFTNNIDNLVLVKTSHYPKVIIITPRLNLRFTNWDTVEEAKKNLEDGDLTSFQIIIDGESYYIIGHSKDDISDFYCPVARLSDEPFKSPFINKQDTYPEFRSQRVFITNATARSIALVAYIFDQQKRGRWQHLDDDEIREYELLLAQESEELARSYNAAMDNFSLIENVVNNLTWEKRMDLFYESDKNKAIEKLKRHVFHKDEYCKNMLEKFGRIENSGVFDTECEECKYFLHVDYLFSLGFRGCRRCNVGEYRITRNWDVKEKRLLITLYQQMLCPTSLIAKVFRCEEKEVAEQLSDITNSITQSPELWSALSYDTSQEIEIDLGEDD